MWHTNVRKDTKAVKMATPRLITGVLFLLLLMVFLPRHPSSIAGNHPGEAVPCDAQAGGISSGERVTKEVPHSKESVSDLKEREAGKPPSPRGNVAMPTHRILRGDNTVAPAPPAGAPAGDENPGDKTPGRTRGD